MTIAADPSGHPGMTLLAITRDPAQAAMLERCGVDWVFVDLEIIGKQERQAGRDTVVSGHSIDDVRAVRDILSRSKLLVRINPWGPWSPAEIDEAVGAGADILMLPFFKTTEEVRSFISAVAGRTSTCLLVETPEAERDIDRIVSVAGIDYVHIGLNDLHLARGKRFMFELLVDGTVERLCAVFAGNGLKYGFGGMARIGTLRPPAENILAEHFRLGSSMVILSRSFCDLTRGGDAAAIEASLFEAVSQVRAWEDNLRTREAAFFEGNRRSVEADIHAVVRSLDLST